jgi:hypothetical protein
MSNALKTGKSLVRDLSDIKAQLQQQINKIDDTINRVDAWSQECTETENYNGYWGYYILEEMTRLSNNASYIGSIRNVIATSYSGTDY